jgi:hypothetical protein
MRKSGEKVEGTRDVSRRPQTTGVHESSRRQVLRFSASLIHRCHSLVGSINRPKRFRLQASRYRHGPPRASRQPGQVRRHLGKMCRRSSVALLNFLLVAARKRQRDPRSVPPSGSGVRCRIRSAPAINDRPQNGHSSSLNPCRKMPNVTFSAALKFPLLTSGEPRRRSFFGSTRKLMRAWRRRWAGKGHTSGNSRTAKNYISCRARRSPPCSRRSTGLAAIGVVVGTVFCLSHPRSAIASPLLGKRPGL